MDKATYLGKKVHVYYFIFVLIFMFGVGNLNLLAGEQPLANSERLAQLQDEKNKKSDEKTISDENIKMFLKQIEIYGQIAKPQTVFIIPGTDPRVDGLRIDRHFFSHIFRPVEKSTLRNVRIKQGKDKDHILW